MKVVHDSQKSTILKKANEALNELMKGSTDRPLLLLVSGGSAMDLLEGIETKHLGSRTTISVLDVRFSTDPSVNNFLQLKATKFYERAYATGADFIETVPHDTETVEDLARRYESALREWTRANPYGRVVITQGIGPDGHTAGIMPYPENQKLFQKLFERESQWVVGYDAVGKNQYSLRVTATIPFLKNIVDTAVVYVVGEEKHDALKRSLAPQGTLYETPARIIKEIKNATVFTNLIT
jgi:6-phosphogluconolactonase/glucosamine-6-phosphate isomerase/deaminase